MPLVDNINVLDVSKAMTARSKNLRRYRVGNDQDFIDYIETVDSLTYEYPRATEEAAKNAIELIKNQTTPENTTTNASMVEDVRNVGSYKVIVTTTTTTTTEAAVAPAPEVGGITWNRNSENVTTWPQEITASTSNSSDKIWYRIDSIKSNGRTQTGEWVNSNSNNVTISVDSDIYAEGSGGYHKRVFVYAQARKTQLTGITYAGEISNRVFAELAPSFSLSFDPPGNSFNSAGVGYYTMPIDINSSAIFAESSEYFYDNASEVGYAISLLYYNQGGVYQTFYFNPVYPTTDATKFKNYTIFNVNNPQYRNGRRVVRWVGYYYIVVDGIRYQSNEYSIEYNAK